MAVNDTRSMNAEFSQGTVDNTYMCLTPNRGNVENPPYDRLTWPNYVQAEQHIDPPFSEANLSRSMLPREFKTANARIDSGFGVQADSDYRA